MNREQASTIILEILTLLDTLDFTQSLGQSPCVVAVRYICLITGNNYTSYSGVLSEVGTDYNESNILMEAGKDMTTST